MSGNYLTREARIVGGIEAKDIETLADALVKEAEAADTDTRASRHVNSEELEALCRLVLKKLTAGVQPDGIGEKCGIYFVGHPGVCDLPAGHDGEHRFNTTVVR